VCIVYVCECGKYVCCGYVFLKCVCLCVLGCFVCGVCEWICVCEGCVCACVLLCMYLNSV